MYPMLTLPETHSALSWAGLCLWALVACLLIFALYEAVSTAMESKSAIPKMKPESSPSSKNTLEINSNDKGFSRGWSMIIALALVSSWALWGGTSIRDHQRIKDLETQLARYDASTVEEHNFTPIAKLDDGDFSYVSDEKPRGDTWRPCLTDKQNHVDASGILEQGIGFTASRVRYEERGICRSILRSDLGFKWRDMKNKFKYTRASR